MIQEVAGFVFWSCTALVLYVYLGYPLTLRVLPARRRVPAAPLLTVPKVAVLIAAYNEEQHIGTTVRNKLELDYPPDRLRVIVVSDGSTDGTDDAVRAVGDARVLLLRQQPRGGKTMALNIARNAAEDAEIIVFSDANSIYDRTALRSLIAAFEDPAVGYATGRLAYDDPGGTSTGAASGTYMRYENWIRRLETRVGSVVGVNGGIDAVRRPLYLPMRADHLPDFVLPLRVVEQGQRVVFCPDAVSHEEALQRPEDEFRMRVRVSLRALHALFDMRRLLSPRYGLFAFQLLVHKVLRYLVFAFLAGALIANAFVLEEPEYRITLALQLAFYGWALVGILLPGSEKIRGLALPFLFLSTNVAWAVAFFKFLRGDRQVTWVPRKGG